MNAWLLHTPDKTDANGPRRTLHLTPSSAANHHLPEVPSAAQIQTEGLELVAMQALLLRKVEELTLHLIQLQKENAALSARVRKLEH